MILNNGVKVVGIGAGGHSQVVLEILQLTGYNIIGLLDNNPTTWGKTVLNVPVLGGDQLLTSLRSEGVEFAFIGVGTIGKTDHRIRIYENLLTIGMKVIKAIHPSAIISSFTLFGQGVTVMAGAIINPGSKIGDNVIINTGAIIEHDCRIGDHTHIAPSATLSGNVIVGIGSHIGIGAVVKQGVTIGDNSIVGAGAVVVNNVPNNVTVVGVPAKPFGRNIGA